MSCDRVVANEGEAIKSKPRHTINALIMLISRIRQVAPLG